MNINTSEDLANRLLDKLQDLMCNAQRAKINAQRGAA